MSNQSPFLPPSLSLSPSRYLTSFTPSTFFLAHLDNRRPWERRTSHPDNEGPSYPVQIFSSTAVCTGTNGPEIRSLNARIADMHTYIYVSFCAKKSRARECGSRFRVAAILHNTYSSRQWIYARSSGRKLHSGRNANIDFTAMKYRAANAMLFLLSVQSSFCLLSPYVLLENFLSATLIVFVDHLRGVKLFFGIFSPSLDQILWFGISSKFIRLRAYTWGINYNHISSSHRFK